MCGGATRLIMAKVGSIEVECRMRLFFVLLCGGGCIWASMNGSCQDDGGDDSHVFDDRSLIRNPIKQRSSGAWKFFPGPHIGEGLEKVQEKGKEAADKDRKVQFDHVLYPINERGVIALLIFAGAFLLSGERGCPHRDFQFIDFAGLLSLPMSGAETVVVSFTLAWSSRSWSGSNM